MAKFRYFYLKHYIFGLIFVVILVLFAILYLYYFQNPKEFRIGFGALTGDANGDGRVNILDYQLLSNSFGKLPGQSGYNQNTDFNGDSRVNILDYQLLSNNFGQVGETPSTPPSPSPRPTSSEPPPSSGSSYYVSNSGNDSNPGTQSQPFRTFSKAISVLSPGNTLLIAGGTYTEKLNINKSGTSGSPIHIRAVSGQNVILDAGYQRDAPLTVSENASNIKVTGISVTRGTFDCVLVNGSNVTLNDMDIYDCRKFGYRIKGQNVTVENSVCRDSVTENSGGSTGGGWGACLRTGPGAANITFRNNHVYNNWGEGIIVGQAAGAKIYGNTVNDNFSVNIYIGNSYDVDVYKNMTYSTNSRFFRSGAPANCISASEESISGWGAQLRNIRVFNNIAYSCKTGVGYTYAEVSGNGCQNCLFAYNTLVDTQGFRVIAGTKNSVTIKNNIINGGTINVPSNSTVSNNLTTDPRFSSNPSTNPQSFRLSSSSPAIDAAQVVSGINEDYDGKARGSNPDIGAFEF